MQYQHLIDFTCEIRTNIISCLLRSTIYHLAKTYFSSDKNNYLKKKIFFHKNSYFILKFSHLRIKTYLFIQILGSMQIKSERILKKEFRKKKVKKSNYKFSYGRFLNYYYYFIVKRCFMTNDFNGLNFNEAERWIKQIEEI